VPLASIRVPPTSRKKSSGYGVCVSCSASSDPARPCPCSGALFNAPRTRRKTPARRLIVSMPKRPRIFTVEATLKRDLSVIDFNQRKCQCTVKQQQRIEHHLRAAHSGELLVLCPIGIVDFDITGGNLRTWKAIIQGSN